MLNATDLTLHYGSSQILHGVSVSARIGEVTCIMGSNGVGKTSLLKILSGTHPSSAGCYLLDGADMTGARPDQLAHAGVGYVPQGRFIFPMLTVRENLQTGFGCLPAGEKFVPDEIYELFPVLKTMLDRRGGDLSGGQQQRVAIARAIINRPALLLADEPTGALDSQTTAEVLDLFDDLHRQGITLVMVTHEDDVAARARQVARFQDGRLLSSTPALNGSQ